MEAVVIKIHGREVCKLVDQSKVQEMKELSKYWHEQLVELQKKNRPEQIKIL